jgi:bacillopeptidase F (M6 metalloprotease family)
LDLHVRLPREYLFLEPEIQQLKEQIKIVAPTNGWVLINGENGTGFWTLMSSGSWIDEGMDTIGNKPSHMGAWEKFQLGWLNYEVARAGQKSEHKLGPMEFNTKQAQALIVVLPEKSVPTDIGAAYAGTHFYYSGSGDNRDNHPDRVRLS